MSRDLLLFTLALSLCGAGIADSTADFSRQAVQAQGKGRCLQDLNTIWEGPKGHFQTIASNRPSDGQSKSKAKPGTIPPPTAVASPIAGPAPLTIQFSGDADVPPGHKPTFRWTFGEGGSANEQYPTYTYPAGTPPGVYRVTLTVTDKKGATSETSIPISITVGAITAAKMAAPDSDTEIVVQDPASPLYGASLLVPSGALSETVVITLGEATRYPSSTAGGNPLVELGPDGMEFAAPVTVTVPVADTVTNPESDRVVAFDEALGRWTGDGISDVAYLGGPERLISFNTTHFTFFSTLATWTITDLGTLGGTSSFAFTVNNDGIAAGYSYVYISANWRRATLWDANGATDLGTLDKHSYIFGINNATPLQAVGYSEADWSTNYRAVIWDSVNGMQDLGTLGGASAIAVAINDSGQVAGFSTNSAGRYHAFVWDETNGMQDLGTLGGQISSALGINNLGTVVGNSDDNGNVSAGFTWTAAGGMKKLKQLPSGKYGAAFDINDSGQVVGEGESLAGPTHGILWPDSTQATDLGTLGGATSSARAINGSAQVVGSSATVSGAQHAFGWDNDGTGSVMTDLNDILPAGSGWVLQDARDINSFGDIVGWGTYGGHTRAFLLVKN